MLGSVCGSQILVPIVSTTASTSRPKVCAGASRSMACCGQASTQAPHLVQLWKSMRSVSGRFCESGW